MIISNNVIISTRTAEKESKGENNSLLNATRQFSPSYSYFEDIIEKQQLQVKFKLVVAYYSSSSRAATTA
jgi:hypothetical protein